MIRLSSIFSFKTLRGSFRPGAAILVTLCVLMMAEIGMRFFTPNLGWYEGLSSLGQWVARLQYDLKTHQPEVWLSGNSVLAYGVDIDRLEQQTYNSAVALPFGGATLAGDTAMVEYFLRRAPVPPKTVVFCLTKDDLNLNGERFWISKRYMEYDTWRGLTIDRIFRLADSRNTIMNYIKSFVLGKSTAAQQPSEASFGGIVSPEKTAYMKRLMLDFSFDEATFPRIASLSKQYGFKTIIVLMPVSDSYIDFHNERNSDLPVSKISEQLEKTCAQYQFDFFNFSEMAPDLVDNFADPYHMTAKGRAQFTPLLGEAIQPAYQGKRTRIACIGDSITYGAGVINRSTQSYPSQLQQLLKGRFAVGNFGISSTTLLRNSGRYWGDTPALPSALSFNPEIVVIMFGINDLAHPDILEQFPADGIALVRQFQALPSSPKVFLCTPTPIAPPKREKLTNKAFQEILIPWIYDIAAQTGSEVIDINSAFPNIHKLLPDTTHPNAEGNAIIAWTVFEALKPLFFGSRPSYFE